jgi:hypothetical protein
MKRGARLLLLLTLLGLLPRPVPGQSASVRGRVIAADGQPLAGQAVLLHRVVGSSGANIAQALSDSAGRFEIAVDSASNPDAVYFLAARWAGELYIGDPFQAPLGAAERVLQVGVPGTSATALLEGTAPPGATAPAAPARGGSDGEPWGWLPLFAGAVTLAGAVLYLVLRNRPRVPERRRVLAQIAELDLRQGAAGGAAYRAERARLLARLHELTGS